MSSKRVALLLAALLCLFAVAPSSLFAQSASTGTVAGTVTDPSGGGIAGATVTLTDTATNIARTDLTNENGRYFFANVVPSKYNVAVSKTGFRVSKLVDQVVNVGASLTLNVTLEIGSVAETVEVTVTTGAELQTLNATVGNTIGGDTLQQLPTIQRDAATFVTLQPGVSPDGSVAGAVTDQSTFMLDGGQNSNDMDGSMSIYTPSFAGDPTGGISTSNTGIGGPTGVMPTPLDSVEEYKVNTANQTADFNSSAGAEVQVVTKRGTNAWHGTAYEYYLDNGLNANTWQNNANEEPNPIYHYNRFGAAGGGPIISKNILGGKTYFFANYEGFRWNNSVTGQWIVPTATMRAGVLDLPVCTGACAAGGTGAPAPVNTIFNLNPTATTVNGVTYAGSGTTLDPRGLGLDPAIAALWAKLPLPNITTGNPCGNYAGNQYCDGLNEAAFQGNYSIPYSSNFGVARLDHDFGSKFHFNSSYRYYKLSNVTGNQVDIGGGIGSDTAGQPVALSQRPQQPWFYVAGLTISVTPNTTNDLHYSFLRNFWSWSNPGGVPQNSAFGGALEPFGEGCASEPCMSAYNVNTQSVRTRFWDGHDNFLRDDWTMLKGNHLFTFGGAYQRNWDYHERSDNGGGINYQPTYLLGNSLGAPQVDFSSTQPDGVNAAQWARDSATVLGIITQAQVAYTRTGSDLTLNPPLTHAFDQSTIPYYNVYFSDSWHIKPSFTFTYGLGWTLEMPPTEAQGKQIDLVDPAGQQVSAAAYLKQREDAALAGQVYNPELGFELVGNTASGNKYPYNPFYGSFSPRLAAAWSPNYSDGLLGHVFGSNKTVVRGGYSRVYGRLNGVDLVLVPLLGDGLIQATECTQNFMPGAVAPVSAGPQCGPGTPTVGNAFRIGTDGPTAPIPLPSATLPQPTIPGVNAISTATGEALDPNFRPNSVDSFDFTIQRQITPKIVLELGYIGRRIEHEYQPININSVPYMMTLGGQQFQKAYANVEVALGCATSFAACGANIPTGKAAQIAYANSFTPQPFFEAALSGTGYCNGFSSCTAAVVYNEAVGTGNLLNQSVWSLWSDLDQGDAQCSATQACGFNFQRSMLNSPIPGSALGGSGQVTSGVAINTSTGHGNYNGAFVSLKTNNWHHITLTQNFTFSKALGTGAVVQASSEYTTNDPYNLNNMYGVQYFNRKFVYNVYALLDDPWYKSQQGFVGRVAGGWSVAPIFAAGSGTPVYCNTYSDAQSFGEGDGANYFSNEQCIFTGAHPYGSTLHANCGSACYNIFANPAALLATTRDPILGLDTSTGGNGSPITGLPYWNMDMRVVKNIRLIERVSTQFEFTVTNVFNHVVFNNPGLNPYYGSNYFGQTTSQGNIPRAMQFGLRATF
jgi:Carboxypeptidase regulatory-like domain